MAGTALSAISAQARMRELLLPLLLLPLLTPVLVASAEVHRRADGSRASDAVEGNWVSGHVRYRLFDSAMDVRPISFGGVKRDG